MRGAAADDNATRPSSALLPPHGNHRQGAFASAPVAAASWESDASGRDGASSDDGGLLDLDGRSSADICALHQRLINDIIQNEDECLQAHHLCLDDSMATMKEEFAAINTLEGPDSSIDTYVKTVEPLLQRRLQSLLAFTERIARLKRLLEEEEAVSRAVNAQDGAADGM